MYRWVRVCHLVSPHLSLCAHSGLIDGYTGERAALDEQLRQKEELQLNLEQELQVRHSKLKDFFFFFFVEKPNDLIWDSSSGEATKLKLLPTIVSCSQLWVTKFTPIATKKPVCKMLHSFTSK